MKRWRKVAAAVLIGQLMVLQTACRRIETAPLMTIDAIPAEYGDFVGVSGSESVTYLWFKKPDRTIVRVVLVNRTGAVDVEVLSIPRR